MYEVVEAAGEWIVRLGEREMGRYDRQANALKAVAEHMQNDESNAGRVSFAMRFQPRPG